MDIQTDILTHSDIHCDIHADRQTNRYYDRHIDRQTDGRTDSGCSFILPTDDLQGFFRTFLELSCGKREGGGDGKAEMRGRKGMRYTVCHGTAV